MNNALLKKAIAIVIGIVGVVALSGSLRAASFDCAKAEAPIEKLICSDETVSKLDVDLAGVYKAAMEKVDNKDEFKYQQRNWLKGKRNACKDAACLAQVYQARISELANLATPVVDNKVYGQAEVGNKKPIAFTLVEGDGYPLCKEYVEMLNKTQYTEIPICSRKILPEFKNFKNINWIEMTDKARMKKVLEERAAVLIALNPTVSKRTFSPHNTIKRINEDKTKMFSYEIVLSNDGVMDTVYMTQGYPNFNRKEKYGYCETSNYFYFDDSSLTVSSIKKYSTDPYHAFSINGSNELFIYGGGVYISIYKGTSYSDYNFIVYGIGNKKMCEILAK